VSNPEDNNIEKIFNEMMSSNSIEDIDPHYDRHQHIRELLHMQESLAESLLNVNSIIYYLVKDSDYKVPDSVSETIGALYKISEDFISHLLELNGIIDEDEMLEIIEEEEDGYGEE
jgi:hypothetical protein